MQDLIPPPLSLILLLRCCWLVATSLTPTLRTPSFYHFLWVETVKETPDQEGLSWARLFLSICSAAVQSLPHDTLLNAFLGRTYERTEAARWVRELMVGFHRFSTNSTPRLLERTVVPVLQVPQSKTHFTCLEGARMRAQPPFPSFFSDSWRDQCSTPLVMSTSVSWWRKHRFSVMLRGAS